MSSQTDLHARFGGVVPEVAGRAHVDLLTPVVAEAMDIADATPATCTRWPQPWARA